MSEILRLSPVFKDYLWGGTLLKEKYAVEDMEKVAEAWVLSTHKDGQSIVDSGSLKGKNLNQAIEILGEQALGKNALSFEMFPQMIKLIDAADSLSIQVHPSDDYALKNEGQYGKTEMWYILDAKEGAGIYYGVKKDVSKEELLDALVKGNIDEVLRFVPVKAGESYFIPSGTVHAIGKGLLIAEVQQNSNVTYRVYDYGRVGADGKPRELHTEKAIAVSTLTPMVEEKEKTAENICGGTKTLLSECPYFRTSKLVLNGEYTFKTENSFVCVLITKGSGSINGESFGMYDTFFVPADISDITLSGDFEALISDCPGR